MKPIIGEISYKDMTSEDINRFIHEAKVMRSAAIQELFKGLARAIVGLVKLPAKSAKPTKVIIQRSDMVGAQ